MDANVFSVFPRKRAWHLSCYVFAGKIYRALKEQDGTKRIVRIMNWDFSELQRFLDDELDGRPVQLLEAGCGSASNLRFGDNVRIAGIDISQKQLERNTTLDEKILGDIQYYEFPAEHFDVIICWDVLEHLPRPQLALRQFARALKPGGIIILKLPNVLSLKGLITKFFPHWLHVLAYRYFYGDKNAGKEDTAPFKAYLRFSISAGAIEKFCAQYGLQPSFLGTLDVGSLHWLQNKKAAFFLYSILKKTCQQLSFGAIGDSDFALVLKKRKALSHSPVGLTSASYEPASPKMVSA